MTTKSFKALYARITTRAYYLHLAGGEDHVSNWLEAERQELDLAAAKARKAKATRDAKKVSSAIRAFAASTPSSQASHLRLVSLVSA